MDGDDWLKDFIFWLLLAGPWAVLIIGHWPRFVGNYQDGGKIVALKHIGGVVWGSAPVSGGRQRFYGLALLGRLYLRRLDYGEGHLLTFGFSPKQAESLDGRCTGVFYLRKRGEDALEGVFVGRRFRFEGDTLMGSAPADAIARLWQREKGS